MAARLWPHAWELFAVALLTAFGLLEDDGFHRRHHLHLTLSRRTQQVPHAALAIAVLGPIVCWIYAAHVASLEDPVPSRVAPPPRGWVRPTFLEEACSP